ncbi:MAG: AIR synthase-related protein [Planctomycetota bacterium]
MTTAPAPTPPPTPRHVTRLERRPAPGQPDPHADAVRQRLAELSPPIDLRGVAHADVYLIEGPLTDADTQAIATELLTDPIAQTASTDTPPPAPLTAEVHFLPGVMDPVASSTEDAIAEMLPHLAAADITVRTAQRFDFTPATDDPETHARLAAWAQANLGNPVIQAIHTTAQHPERFPAGEPYAFKLTHIPIRDLDDAALQCMSRDAHLFLSLEEMQAIQSYYRGADREPTDIELETLAQTWSEHCVHKTLKSTVSFTPGTNAPGSDDPGVLNIFRGKPGHELNPDGSVTIHNLLKSTVAAATFKLRDDFQGTPKDDFLVSVFDDNAGIVKFDETHGIAIKVETHNHPSALEPYGGAATGIGGCIRDIMGTGLSAKPIANTDTFCVAPPDTTDIPSGVIPPRRTLHRVVDGVRDYGNRMGIPTVNGAVHFHPDFIANPLVFAGCVGLIPLDKCFGDPQPGDRIVILGGATGRDGIHGATFSSAELTDTHADEFAHAVQIGNAITQKKTLDVILQARDYTDPETGETHCLFNAISDCGAGGFSSAVGEMGEKVGARVTLDTAPLKYDGLSYTEVWISEAQERMPLAVPPRHIDTLKALCDAEDVPFCDLGEFGYSENDTPTLQLLWHGTEVGKLAMPFMHDGIPTPTRTAKWPPPPPTQKPTVSDRRSAQPTTTDLATPLLQLLAHPNLASKHWVIRQYDHEVQGGSVVKPLVGPQQDGPSDAAVLRPKLDSPAAITLSNGLAPQLSEKATATGLATNGDSYQATLHALDEAVRNAVCVGADPNRLAILDNFCWPRCGDPYQLGSLVLAAEACYDGALAYQAPFVSGKDSLSNQFTTEDGRLITIPPTLLITALGYMPDATKAVTMDAKASGHTLLLVGHTTSHLGGAHLLELGFSPDNPDLRIPSVDLTAGPRHAAAVAPLIDQRLVAAAHDCSEGGLLPAAAEMAFAGRVGLDLNLSAVPTPDPANPLPLLAAAFAESPSRYLLEIAPDHLDATLKHLESQAIPHATIGTFTDTPSLTARTDTLGRVLDTPLDALRQAWLGTLDW